MTAELVPLERLRRAGRLLRRSDTDMLSVLVGIRLAREHKATAEDIIITLGQTYPPEQREFLAQMVRFIADGTTGNPMLDYSIEHAVVVGEGEAEQ